MTNIKPNPPIDYLSELKYFELGDLLAITKSLPPSYHLKVSSRTEKSDFLLGTSEGPVTRVVVVPELEEVVFVWDGDSTLFVDQGASREELIRSDT